MKARPSAHLSFEEYKELATFRYQIRRFLHFSESVAVEHGVETSQHQALLAIKAIGADCTVGTLADQLFLKHQSTVGLVDRMEIKGLISREHNSKDRRQVFLMLTQKGEEVLASLSVTHRKELGERAPELARALQTIMHRAKSTNSK